MTRFALLAAATLFASTLASQEQGPSHTLYLEGRGHLLEERFERAANVFRRLVSEHPSSEEADDAQYYLGYAYEQLGRREEAIEAFGVLLDRWPESVRVESARSHRAQLASERGSNDLESALLDDIFGGSSSWELKRDTAYALARRGNFAADDVLEEAMERESSSRQSELIRILSQHTSDRTARRILVMALDASRSTSVSIRALQALRPVARDRDVTGAIERLLTGSASTSVKVAAVNLLGANIEDEATRRALGQALDISNSTSVQILACATLGEHVLEEDVRPTLIRVFRESYSTSVQLRCLQSVEHRRNDLAAAEVLRQAVSGSGNSTSVKLKAVQIAASSTEPAVRAAARAALLPDASTSVQLQAVRAFTEGVNEESAAETLEGLFEQGGVSTSVHIAALDALARHLDTEAAPRAIERALEPGISTSVQLKALEVASKEIDREPMRRAVATALRRDNSTSVQLKAVEVLGRDVDVAASRRALASVLVEGYSTSVVLSAVAVLEEAISTDSAIRQAFVRLIEDVEMSTTARVRGAEALVAVADADGPLRTRIADAMEDVVVRSRRRGRSGHRDVIEDALDVMEKVDPARAERLRDRSGSLGPWSLSAGPPLFVRSAWL